MKASLFTVIQDIKIRKRYTIILLIFSTTCFAQSPKDTINQRDIKGKQGYWATYYKDSTIKEQGYYKDNKKTGLWKEFRYKKKHTIEDFCSYQNNRKTVTRRYKIYSHCMVEFSRRGGKLKRGIHYNFAR